MNCLDPEFKLPEVAFAAGISASNLTNWYDRDQVESFCKEKDGWKSKNALDVMHVALVRELTKNGVPVPSANTLSARLFRYVSTIPALQQMHPIAFADVFEGGMFVIIPNGTGGYRTSLYVAPKQQPPEVDVGFVIIPLGAIWRRSVSRAMTGDKRAVVQLGFDSEAEEQAHRVFKEVFIETALENPERDIEADTDRDDRVVESIGIIDEARARLAQINKVDPDSLNSAQRDQLWTEFQQMRTRVKSARQMLVAGDE